MSCQRCGTDDCNAAELKRLRDVLLLRARGEDPTRRAVEVSDIFTGIWEGYVGPHASMDDCPLWYDGCACPPVTPVDVVAAVRRDPSNGKVWLAKRNADGRHAGLANMWEYPGGKVEPDEQLHDAMKRELDEEFGERDGLYVGRVLDSINSTYDGVTYRVTFFDVEWHNEVELRCHTEVGWFSPYEACELPHLPSGTIFNARHLANVDPMVVHGNMGEADGMELKAIIAALTRAGMPAHMIRKALLAKLPPTFQLEELVILKELM